MSAILYCVTVRILQKTVLSSLYSTLEKYSGQLVAGPDIVTRGFVYVREAEELLDEAREVVSGSVETCMDKKYYRLEQN